MTREDWAQAERHAHTLKGVAAQIGAREISHLAGQLELALHKRAPTGQLDELNARLATVLTVLIEAISARLPQDPVEVAQPRPDQARLVDACRRLVRLLGADDFASGQLFDANDALLRAGLGEDYPQIAEAIHNYDFPAALYRLTKAIFHQRIAV